MQYFSFNIQLKQEDPQGIIQAVLTDFPFDGILDEGLSITGYIGVTNDTELIKGYLFKSYPDLIENIKIELIPDMNWNAEWEKGFEEVKVHTFCQVRASFHEPAPDCQHSIIIDPKMAFGTGHHETTYMMIEAMDHVDFRHKKVFDFGCGTGILSILAAKLGAGHVLGIDNEVPAIENARENGILNQTSEILWSLEDIEELADEKYDVILANINRNVLLQYMPVLQEKLDTGGIILLSGILESDKHMMIEALAKAGLEIDGIKHRGEWICISAGLA